MEGVSAFEGLAALGFGFGGDEVGGGFGLEEVQFAVLEGAAGEFAGFGGAGAATDEGAGDGGEDGAAAVEGEFGAVFAGEAVWCWEGCD